MVRIVSLLLLFLLPTPRAVAALRVVGATGQPSSGFNFRNIGRPSLNADGNVAFTAILQEGNQKGIWTDASGGLETVAKVGDPLPGDFSVLRIFDVWGPLLNDAGEIAYKIAAEEPNVPFGATREAILRKNGASTSILAARDGVAPGGYAFNSFNNYELSENGTVVIQASLKAASDSDSGIWSMNAQESNLIARKGDQAPGLPIGARFEYMGFVDVNNLGNTAFVSGLRNNSGGVNPSNNSAIWVSDNSGLQLVAREGALAAGVPGDAVFGGFSNPLIDQQAGVAFGGSLVSNNSSVTTLNDTGIWTNTSGQLTLIAREGNSVHPRLPGVHFSEFSVAQPLLSIGNNGRVVFRATMQTGSGIAATYDRGIWSYQDGELNLVSRDGFLAPGMRGARIDSLLSSISVNVNGMVAFTASLVNGVGGVTASSDVGLWAQDPSGRVRLIARTGDLVEVSPGNLQPIQEIFLGSNTYIQEWTASDFNSYGQVAFVVRVPTGVALLVSDALTDPIEPADFNADGAVDTFDVMMWREGIGSLGGPDANSDGETDGADFLEWQRSMATAMSQASESVPEPKAFLLAAVTCASLLSRRLRRPQG